MCCFFLSLLLLGPRIVGAFWWLMRPGLWQIAFGSWMGLWWIWPVLGIIFLPWSTLMYVIVAPGGVNGLDWLGVGLMLVADFASYVGGARRHDIPQYEGY